LADVRKAGSSRLVGLIVWSLSTTMAMAFACIAFASLYFFFSNTGLLNSSSVQQFLFSIAFSVIGGLIGGGIVGAGQWFVLRYEVGVRWAGSWFRATLVSWGVVAVAWWLEYQILGGSNFEINSQDVVPAIIITGLLSGAIVGLVQWMIMRSHVVISSLWIVTSGVSWLIAAVVSSIVVAKLDLGQATYPVALLALGLIIGFGAGLARPWLVDHQRQH
jgi:hypothetical protein